MNLEKPWLAFYEEHVPEHIDYPDTTLQDILTEKAKAYPQHTAMIFKNKNISYLEFDQAADRFAAGLQKLGLQQGDRVAIHLPNCPQFPIAYYGVLRAGGIVVPCNPIYTARELSHQISDSGSKIILTLSSTYPLVKKIQADSPIEHIIVAKIKTYFPAMLKLLFTLLREKKMGHKVDISGDKKAIWYTDFISQAPAKPEPKPINLEDTAVLMYTGGTTGLSKGAQLSHKNILVNAIQGKYWINAKEAGQITMTTLPLFHSYGMTTCLNASVVTAGMMILIPNPRDIDDIIKSIDKHRPTYYPGVPAMYISVNNYPDIKKYDLSSIQVCSSGAAPLPKEVQEQFQAITGARLAEGFGLSEASPVTHGNPAFGENRIGTVGIPWPDTEVKIVDAEIGDDILPIGEVGEICIRGPQIMKGYWQLPSETANALRPDPDGGEPWLYTGDLGCMDEDGYFQIVDRKKDMIVGFGGYNVYPSEIEEVLYQNSKVLEAAVVGIPVEGKGERVKAYIVLKEGQPATEKEIIDFCSQHLAPHKLPKMVEFRTELPKTLVGKVLRRELLAEEQARAEKAANP